MKKNTENSYKPKNKLPVVKKDDEKKAVYAAIDLGTNSCRLILATPTPTSFSVVETYSKVTRLGEGIINDNELSKAAIRRTVAALKVCSGILNEYAPLKRMRFVATAACRRAKNCAEFSALVKRETGLEPEIISAKEEARLAVVGCVPLLNRNIKRMLVFDIGGGSTEISLARATNSGKVFIEDYVSLPYGVVTVSEAFEAGKMSNLEYSTVLERTQKIIAEFDEKYNIYEGIKNQEIQVIGTSGTVTVLGAVYLNLPRYNRSAVDGISISGPDLEKVIEKIKHIGHEGRCKHPCIGPQKSDLTIAGCAIIEGICTYWPIAEITVADRGIREGILLDMMHHAKNEKAKFHRRHNLYWRKNRRGNKNSGKTVRSD